MNRQDARQLGLKTDDKVRLVGPGIPEGEFDLGNGKKVKLIAKVDVIEGIRPGVLGVSHHYGHWAYGANDVDVDGQTVKGDRRRAGGITPNPLFMCDPVLEDVVLSCPIGSSTSFSDSNVNVVKV